MVLFMGRIEYDDLAGGVGPIGRIISIATRAFGVSREPFYAAMN